jgi:DNA-binding response OmpR family regulator
MDKLLIVEDEKAISQELKKFLEPHGWHVEVASTGSDGMQLLGNFQYDFVLLDWNLPDMSGVEICRRFRAQGGTTPIIFLTGRNTIDEKEEGLNAGGDDYMTKPYDVRELLARIRTVRRRPRELASPRLIAHGFELNPYLKTLVAPNGTAQLTALESHILEYLMRNRNRYFSSADLFEAIWPSDSDSSPDTVRVLITLLRRKLDQIGAKDLIKTVRRLGYIIDDGDTTTSNAP